MVEAIRILRGEHAKMARLLDLLDRELALYAETGGIDRVLLDAVLDYCQGFPALCHHPKEDLLYDKLRAIADEALLAEIGDLRGEHEELNRLLEDFLAARSNLLSEPQARRDKFLAVAREFVARYRAHMRGEEEVFFPATLRLLSEEDWAEVDGRALSRTDPLFGDPFEARFEKLRQEIMGLDRPGRAAVR